MSQLEDHQDVKNFHNMTEPSVDIMAKAYFTRDIIMNKSLESKKESILKKLGYTHEKIQRYIDYEFKKHLYTLVDKFLKNPNNDTEYNFLNEYNEFKLSEGIKNYTETRKQRFEILNVINNHQDFYMAMTVEELEYLGW